LVHFNQAGGGSDYSDWGGPNPAAGAGNTPPQVQDAFGSPNQQPNLSANELTALDVVGWNLTTLGMSVEGVPEPATVSLLAAGFLGAGLLRRNRKL
jgi:hypothetical protein